MTEIEQLKEEIAKLRERVAVLEARPVYHAPVWNPPFYVGTPNPWPKGPYEVTCKTAGSDPPLQAEWSKTSQVKG